MSVPAAVNIAENFRPNVTSLLAGASHGEPMTRSWKMAGLLLLLTGMLGSLTAQAILTLSVHEATAGCHGHGRKPPLHAPSSTACCIAGHHSAIVPSSGVPQSLLTASAIILSISSRYPLANSSNEAPLAASGAPPGTQPLRI